MKLSRITLSIFCSVTILSPPAFSIDGTVNFDSKTLICVAVNSASTKTGLRESILARLNSVSAVRDQLSKDATGGNLIQTRIAKSLMYHSVQFLPSLNAEEISNFLRSADLWTGMVQIYSDGRSAKPVPELVLKSDTLNLILGNSEIYIPASGTALEQEYAMRFEVLSQSFIRMLLQLPMNSMTPAELLRRTLTLYDGDLLTALGVMAHAFDKERMMTTTNDGIVTSRNRLSLLGSKVIPLYLPTQNPIGLNYHFWAYLNMALQGSVASERIFNLAYESWAQDSDESTIDRLGMNVGSEIRNLIINNERCGKK